MTMTQSALARQTVARANLRDSVFDAAALTRRYLAAIERRALCEAATVNDWKGRIVRVFLRHQADHVFAIAADDLIGMADFVAIEDVTFHVDEAGRQQACRRAGVLPNGRNVHAYVQGRLLWATMHSRLRPSADWRQVVYNPEQMTAFRLRRSKLPIHRAELVVFTPNPTRVWQVPAVNGCAAEATT